MSAVGILPLDAVRPVRPNCAFASTKRLCGRGAWQASRDVRHTRRARSGCHRIANHARFDPPELGKFRAARTEITIHDDDARERNDQLVIWVDDETQGLVVRLQAIKEDFSSRGVLMSSLHDAARMQAKADALHRYRDEASRARLDIAALRAREGRWHRFWRKRLGSPAPRLTADAAVQPFLDRWREPMKSTMAGVRDIAPLDRTTRTLDEGLRQLPDLPLT